MFLSILKSEITSPRVSMVKGEIGNHHCMRHADCGSMLCFPKVAIMVGVIQSGGSMRAFFVIFLTIIFGSAMAIVRFTSLHSFFGACCSCWSFTSFSLSFMELHEVLIDVCSLMALFCPVCMSGV